jgi:hypothetical protein
MEEEEELATAPQEEEAGEEWEGGIMSRNSQIYGARHPEEERGGGAEGERETKMREWSEIEEEVGGEKVGLHGCGEGREEAGGEGGIIRFRSKSRSDNRWIEEGLGFRV